MTSALLNTCKDVLVLNNLLIKSITGREKDDIGLAGLND